VLFDIKYLPSSMVIVWLLFFGLLSTRNGTCFNNIVWVDPVSIVAYIHTLFTFRLVLRD
jgi:hypothetical protein